MVRIITVAHSLILIWSLELEPRRPRDEVSDLYVNLGATFEDHGEVSEWLAGGETEGIECTAHRRETRKM